MTDGLPGAGPELDAMVADALGGGNWASVSTMSGVAMEALEVWRAQHPGWGYEIRSPYDGDDEYTVTLFPPMPTNSFYEAFAATLPVAICHAIMRAHRGVQS